MEWLVCPLACSQPDPAGARLAVLRPALEQLDYIIGLFFDFSSLYQPPRTADQDAIFKKALPPCVPRLFEPTDPPDLQTPLLLTYLPGAAPPRVVSFLLPTSYLPTYLPGAAPPRVVSPSSAGYLPTYLLRHPYLPSPSLACLLWVRRMNQLYASAVGTTVLQIKEIPPRPTAFDGKLCLFGPGKDVSEAEVRSALERFGTITTVVDRRIELGRDEIAVHFTTHQAVLDAVAADLKTDLWKGLGALYNDRPYDERGWCACAA